MNNENIIVRHNIDCKPFRFCISFSYMIVFVHCLLQVVSNVLQNDSVRVHANVKSLVPFGNVGQCIYLIISSCFLLIHFRFRSHDVTQR